MKKDRRNHEDRSMREKNKGRKQGVSKYIRFTAYLSTVVLLNVAGLTLFIRFDLTENSIYSLSDASKRVVKTLSEPLTIKLFFTENLPAPYNNIERYLKDLLGEYAIHANRFFNYRFYSVSPDDEGAEGTAGEYQKLAGNYGIHPVQIQAVEKDEVKFKKAYMGLVLIHGDMIERLPTVTTINGLEYDLTTAIMKLNNKISALLNLKEKVGVHLVISSSLKQVAPVMGIEPIVDYPEKVKQIVAKLNEKLYGRLEYRYTDPSEEKGGGKEPGKYNLMRLKWPALTEQKIPAGSGEVGLVLTHGNKVREIPVLNAVRMPIIGTRYSLVDPGQLEEMIEDNLETLIDINEDLGYLADHGTPGISPSSRSAGETLSTFAALASENYTLKPIRLDDDRLLTGLRCLVIARPTEKFSDFDLYRIDQALMHGTNLAVFLDAFRQESAQQPVMGSAGPVLKPFDTGLEKLLRHYGVEIKSAIVMDKHCHRQPMPRHMGGGEVPVYYVPILKNENINKELEFMKYIKGLVAIKMSPVVPVAEKISANRIDAQMLFASSGESWEASREISLNPMLIRPPESEGAMKAYSLGYLLEGSFPSYFAGKPMPEKPVDKPQADAEGKTETGRPAPEAPSAQPAQIPDIEGKGGFLEKSRKAKILLVSSSDMLTDSVLDPEGKTPNSVFILNALDALNDRQDIAVMRSKEQRFNPLRETGPFTRTLIKFFNVIGLPVLVVLFGLLQWWRRHAWKKQIQMMFRRQERIV